MSISNLFEPNNYDLFCDSLTADTLNFETETLNTLAVNTITSNPAGGSLTIQGDIIDQTGRIIQPTTTDNRKLVMFPSVAGDSTNFFGFGVNPNVLRYQVNTTSSDHVFYASTGLGTAIELFRVKGSGGGFILPSVGAAFPSQLNYYEIFDTTLTLGGAIQSVPLPANFSITLLGNTVTITCLSNNLGAYLTTGAITTTPAIPSRFLPTIKITSPILVYNGDADALGTFQILTSGIINIWSAAGGGYNSPNFSNTGAIGFPPFSISYNLT